MMIHIPKMYTLLLKIHLFEIIIKEKENNHFKKLIIHAQN